MTSFRIVTAAVVLATLAIPALGTDVYYPDSYAISANGRFRVDAKSPDNAGPSPKAFAERFLYTLSDVTTGKTVWRRRQPMTREKGSPHAIANEPSPVQVFVHDTGLVVARTAWHSVVFLDAANGENRGEAEILRAFPENEIDKFVVNTSAGPMWSRDSEWFFVTIPATGHHPPRIYFVVRPYWNRRLVIDASTGKHVALDGYYATASSSELVGASEHVRTVLTATLEEEARRVETILAGAPERLEKDSQHQTCMEVLAALHTVGFRRLAEAEPHLRSLERAIADLECECGSLSRRLRETLRTLGKRPAPGYGVRLYPMVARESYFTEDIEHPYNASVPVEERAANARNIVAEMPVARMTELIGSPDASLHEDGHRCYDYDIDASEPYTLRVYLDEHNRLVLRSRILTPFAFLSDPARMRSY